jgi:multiple sugar transport system ATP-binding protein
MTVEENMAFSLRLARVPKDEIKRRVASAAVILGLDSYLERYPRHLSGGQRQRVAMGRAIVRNPRVFLFDEPLSNLDAKLRVQMRSEIKLNHQRLKTTTVYVTHDQIEAMTMADRIVVMHDGVIEQIGTPLELYDRPANLFVAGFIGSPAMNMIKGKIEGGNFVADDGTRIPLGMVPGNSAGRSVTLGVRPEHFSLDPSGVDAEVLTVEPTGSETHVVARFAGNEIMGAFRERITTQPGQMLKIRPEGNSVHLFDAESGRRIAL